MVCSDCIHYDVCYYRIGSVGSNREGKIINCSTFKDKSRFIELPCKVGDTVYLVGRKKVIPLEVFEIDIQEDYLDEFFSSILYCKGYVDGEWACLIINWRRRYKKDIFLTKKEAEKALAERLGEK